jgi:putative spermidine/putrescine transport system permease protein
VIATAPSSEAAGVPAPLDAAEGRVRWEVLIVPLVLVHAVVFVLPLLLFAANAFRGMEGPALVGGDVTLRNFASVVLDGYYQKAFLRSAALSAATALVTLVLGYPVAYLLSRSGALWTRLLLLVLISSVFVSLVVRTLGWKTVLDDNGMLGRLVAALPLIGGSVKLLSSPLGILVGLVHTELPFMILILLPVLQSISPSLEEAAAGLGAGRALILWRVLLPLSRPGIVAGALLVFSVSMGLYVPPALLGGNLVATMPTLIYSEAMVALNYPMAAALSTVLALVVIATVGTATWMAARSTRELA